jgi:hypothetical protein
VIEDGALALAEPPLGSGNYRRSDVSVRYLHSCA